MICGSKDNLTLDHIIPSSKGGGNGYDNLQTMCKRCNLLKADKLISNDQLKIELHKIKIKFMNKENVKQIVQELFRENIRLYPESYPLNEDGTATNEASEAVGNWAESIYKNRVEFDIERDQTLGVTQIDYVEWAFEAFSDKLPSDLEFKNPFNAESRDQLWDELRNNSKPISREEVFKKIKPKQP